MWQTAKLGELMKIARGGSPRPIKSYITDDDDGVNWIKIGDTEAGGKYIYSTKEKIRKDGISRSRYVKEGDFLLSNSMSYGRPYILKTDGCIHDGWLVLSEYQSQFDPNYLYYLLSSPNVRAQFDNAARGSTVSNLNIDLVSQVFVSFPPLAEQERIVAKLDAAFAEIDRAMEANEKATGKLENLHTKALSEVACGSLSIKNVTISEVADMVSGFAFKSERYTENKTDTALLRGDNIAPLEINLTSAKRYPTDDLESYKRFLLEPDDIVLGMDRPWISSGLRVAKIEKLHLPCLLVQRVMRLRSKCRILPDFLYLQLQTERFLKHILGNQTGLGVPHISGKTIGSFAFQLPEIEEQVQAIRRYKKLNEFSSVLRTIKFQKQKSLSTLKSAMLAQELRSEAA
jgi:type I restriction enzyme, S subunit